MPITITIPYDLEDLNGPEGFNFYNQLRTALAPLEEEFDFKADIVAQRSTAPRFVASDDHDRKTCQELFDEVYGRIGDEGDLKSVQRLFVEHGKNHSSAYPFLASLIKNEVIERLSKFGFRFRRIKQATVAVVNFERRQLGRNNRAARGVILNDEGLMRKECIFKAMKEYHPTTMTSEIAYEIIRKSGFPMSDGDLCDIGGRHLRGLVEIGLIEIRARGIHNSGVYQLTEKGRTTSVEDLRANRLVIKPALTRAVNEVMKDAV